MSEATVGASVADPLAGVERPAGDPGALTALGGRYEAGSASLTSTARELAAMVGRVLGQSWSGAAAASCGVSCLRSAQVVLVAGQAYGTAGAALRQHGARLAAAQAAWDSARRLADEAMAEERAHRQAAMAAAASDVRPLSFSDLMWQSPLRNMSRARAEQAVADANGSARQTAGALDGTLAPFRPPAPTPVPEESHWYDQIVGFGDGVWDGVSEPVAMVGGLVGLNGDVSDNWSALGSGLKHGVTHPADLGKAIIGWDDLSEGNYGHWAGELVPGIVAAFFTGGAAAGVKGVDAAGAASRAGDKVNAMAAAAKGLPGALKDVRLVMMVTPEGIRLPAGVDASSLKQLFSEAAAGAASAGGRLPRPSLSPDPDAVPRGRPHQIDPKESPENKLALQRQNETALLLRRKYGYDVEHLELNKGEKSPDYKVEGRVFDHYAPTSPSARNIASVVEGKVESGQTQRIALNLDDTSVSLDALRKQLVDWPIQGLEEVIAVRNGELYHIYP